MGILRPRPCRTSLRSVIGCCILASAFDSIWRSDSAEKTQVRVVQFAWVHSWGTQPDRWVQILVQILGYGAGDSTSHCHAADCPSLRSPCNQIASGPRFTLSWLGRARHQALHRHPGGSRPSTRSVSRSDRSGQHQVTGVLGSCPN